MIRKITTGDFIRRAREKHGDRYDYSQSEYVGAREKLIIICPIHGPWQQSASSHLAGNGCPGCGGRKQLTSEEFINRAREIHGDKYDYSKTEYRNSATPLVVVCPEHGEVRQKPHDHLKGTGCPQCGLVQKSLSRRGSTEDFIRRAREVHGDRYDYSKTEYTRGHDKVTIICAEHGEFMQTPSQHLSGNGCKLCGFKNAGQYHKKNTDKFIAAARKIHGDSYDYSKTQYVGARESLTALLGRHALVFVVGRDPQPHGALG
ncbi:MAG: DUF723 domain-containing protein [Planctomycetes bacterium]|nr:DUF723 domain-containing protein [Planctomycetota bacterium]